MKQTWIIIVSFLIFISCHNEGQKNNTDSQEKLTYWYNNVFTTAADDTTTAIPDYAFSTDWMQRYVHFIESKFDQKEDLLFGEIDGESFDCRYWTLAYVDSDTIPELLLYGGSWSSGSIILTQYGCEVYASPRGRFSYIRDANGLLHSQWKHDDDVWGEIYDMKNGKFTEIANYACNTDLIDTNEVGIYGLTLDSLKCHYAGGEIGDSTVSISEIELNGKRIGACFGYNQYVSCSGFATIRQTLDSLYYSKGTSTRFPFPETKLTISELKLKEAPH